MKNRKNAEAFSDRLGEIDGRYITEAEAYTAPARKGLWKRPAVRRGIALAASLCLVAGVALAATLLLPGHAPTDSQGSSTVAPPPTYDGTYLTADDIGALFGYLTDGVEGATKAYTVSYYPEGELPLSPIPDDEYIPVYRFTPAAKALDRAELEAFIEDIYPRLEEALGITIPEVTVKGDTHEDQLVATYDRDGIRYLVDVTQTSAKFPHYDDKNACHRLLLTTTSRSDTLAIDGIPVSIDRSLSDEEILASLERVRDRLFEVFGQSFDAAKVTREYDASSENDAIWVYVSYYNASDPEGKGDEIRLSFNNYRHRDDDTVSSSVLQDCHIFYTRHRVTVADTYVAEANCRRLSLAEAEALLNAGYVFGGHVCPLCMAQQTPVSFDDYEYVELVYVTGDAGESGRALSVPFYAFYKDIGEAKNGNRTYARTLVPAVEIKGLEAYFEMQKANHRDPVVDTVVE